MGLWGKITGKDKRRAKRRYNSAVNEYESYERSAQNTINSLQEQLASSAQHLQGLEQQKYFSSLKSSELAGHVNNYQSLLSGYNSSREKIESEATSLKSAFEEFAKKAPSLANKISGAERMPQEFQSLYDTISAQKQSLNGLSQEEAEGAINKHTKDVENLKKNRELTENKLKLSMDEITKEHLGLRNEKTNLLQRLESYKQNQDKYLNETNEFNSQRQTLENTIKEFKAEQDRINSEYDTHKTGIQTKEKELQDYINNAQNHLNSLGGNVDFRAKKYKKAARNTGIVQGLGLGALTFGAGAALNSLSLSMLPWKNAGASMLGSIASGLKYAAPLLGIGHYAKTANSARGLSLQDKINLSDYTKDSNVDLSHLAKHGLSGAKTIIPELGNLKQSLSHFDMPIIPNIKDLPKLNDALGKITSLKDIEALGLGLPSLTSASGKKYSSAVLYDPKFLKKLKRVSRSWGMNHLRGGADNNNVHNTNLARVAYA